MPHHSLARNALPLLLAILVAAGCAEGDSDPAPEPEADAHALSEAELESTYDQIQGHYNQMMGRFEELQERMGPEMVEQYAEMESRYGEVLGADAETRIEPGAMYERMSEMEDGERWRREMLEMHREMAAAHERAGLTEMAGLHRRLAELYQETLEPAGAGR